MTGFKSKQRILIVRLSQIFRDSMNLARIKCCRDIVCVIGQLYYLSSSKVKNKQNIPELQSIVSFNKPDDAQSIYQERWQIETAFKALKTSEFYI